MHSLTFDVAHMLAGSLVLLSFVQLYQDRLYALLNTFAAHALVLPRDGTGWAGLVLLTCFYCIATTSLFFVLPRITATSTAALNFEPIALLALAWIFLGHTMTPLQLVGAFITVGAIAWLGATKR